MNLAQARIESRNGSLAVGFGDQLVGIPPEVTKDRNLDAWAGREVTAGIRPEDLVPAGDGANGPRLSGKVERVEELGPEVLVYFSVNAPGPKGRLGRGRGRRRAAGERSAHRGIRHGVLRDLRAAERGADRRHGRGGGRREAASTSSTRRPTRRSSAAGEPLEQRRERLELVLGEVLLEECAHRADVPARSRGQTVSPEVGQLRVDDAEVRGARRPLDQAGRLEPLEQARHAGRGQDEPPGELDALQAPALGLREQGERLVVVDREPVLLELGAQEAGRGCVPAQELGPRPEGGGGVRRSGSR